MSDFADSEILKVQTGVFLEGIYFRIRFQVACWPGPTVEKYTQLGNGNSCTMKENVAKFSHHCHHHQTKPCRSLYLTNEWRDSTLLWLEICFADWNKTSLSCSWKSALLVLTKTHLCSPERTQSCFLFSRHRIWRLSIQYSGDMDSF